jgi:UDP-N-acetylmuramate dehydrogenase
LAPNVQLRDLTTLGVGGAPARYFHPRAEDELARALRHCARRGLPWRVLGGGSNLLVDDGPLPFAVIHVHAPGFDWVELDDGGAVRAGAGTATARLLARCRRGGLGGLEFLAGLPGTLGGAAIGNAGAWGSEIADVLTALTLMRPDGTSRRIPRSELHCSYRGIELGGGVVTAVELALQPRSPELVAARMARHARQRAVRHPLAERSAGCVFKNPPSQAAGRLLDLCGLKGRAAGGAQVSARHANFIVNRGGAAAADVLRLIEQMKAAVRREFGIELELEVQHWAERPRAA